MAAGAPAGYGPPSDPASHSPARRNHASHLRRFVEDMVSRGSQSLYVYNSGLVAAFNARLRVLVDTPVRAGAGPGPGVLGGVIRLGAQLRRETWLTIVR